jgi:hypothetical protein
MWPFKRKEADQSDNVPSEVQEYYQAEQRERMGVAWLLAFATLVVTVLVVLGLFFSGRAIYRKFHKTTPVATAPQTTAPATPVPRSSTPTNKPQSTPSSGSKKSNTSSRGTVTAPGPSVTTKPNQGKTSSKTIANTGPGQTAAAAFIVASMVGFAAYELRLRRKFN